MSANFIHPALVMIIGALLVPFVRGPLRKPFLFIVPLLALLAVVSNSFLSGEFATYQFMDWQLVFGRVDKLSTVFAYIMAVMAVIGTLYGLHVDKAGEHMAAWFYVAGSLGTIYAGDYLTVFLFWEMMAFGSVFLIWEGPAVPCLRLPLSADSHHRWRRTPCRNHAPLPGCRRYCLQPP